MGIASVIASTIPIAKSVKAIADNIDLSGASTVEQTGSTAPAPGAGDPISVADIQEPEAPVNFQAPPVEQVPDVGDLLPQDAQLTESEQQAQGLTEDLQGLNQQLLGESEFRTAQEDARGLEEKLTAQTALESRLGGLRREALAIPLQLQEEARGRGITKAGLQPLQTARLRTNAIASLGVASQLEATRGNIELANSLVDRAVAAKYDPVREKIEAHTANLDLIINSPKFSLEQQNRAEKRKAIEDARMRELERAENDERARREFAVTGAELGIDSSILDQVVNAGSYEEAFSLIAPHISALAQSDRKAAEKLKAIQMKAELTRIDQMNFAMKLKAAEVMEAQKLDDMAVNTESEAAAEKALGVFSLASALMGESYQVMENGQMVTKYKGADGFGAAVGKGFKKSVVSKIPFVSGEATPASKRAGFEADARRLANLLTLDNMKLMTGVLSESDIQILESAGSALGNFDLSEKKYMEELERVKDVAMRNYTNLGITEEQASFWFDLGDDDLSEINSAYGETPAGDAVFDPNDHVK